MTASSRIAAFLERIDRLAERWNRDPRDIRIVAITKGFPVSVAREAVESGIGDIGENRVQELLSKAEELDAPCRWHMVGHLQTNKVKHVVGRVAMVHSVDSCRLAEALEKECGRKGENLEVLLQVNTTGEESKHGVEPEGAVEAAGRVAELPHLELTGLMTIGPFTDVRGEMTRSFAMLRLLRDRYNDGVAPDRRLRHLSMGMSGDYEIAIAEGATYLRIGTALFGPRP
jgi:pyridoxal phosphate enzyme (YggS family)